VKSMSRKGIGGRKMGDARQRFDEKWMPEPNSGCWLWIGAYSSFGYGQLWGGKSFGVPGNIAAHQASWIFNRGPIPDGMVIMHKCDNPSCVNPDHLRVGTFKDNTADMLRKNRSPKGESSYRAILKEADIKVIRDRSIPIKELTKRFGVTKAAIDNIRLRRSWRHVQ